ncbi:MAG: hypothetical protein ABI586_01615 [Candidatus Nanopelagicales bacterium]
MTLHIGAFKTGTSFIQNVLMNSRETLAELGVLWPGGDWATVVQSVQGLRGQKNIPYERWEQLVAEIDAFPGESVVMSMEFLSLVKPEGIRRAVDSLSKHRVRVMLTMRDIGRAIPAQWQESVQNGSSWTYDYYLDAVTQRKPRLTRAGQHFWSKQDAARILEAWGECVPAEDLLLVTVPPSGAPSSLLWERFCAAAGLPADRFDATIRVNESLGAASAEVMRYVMARADDANVDSGTRKMMKKILAKQILSSRKSSEPTLLLPPEHYDWAVQRSERMVKNLSQLGPTIVGDLDDLIPAAPAPKGATTTDPSAQSIDELLSAAAYGLVGMSEEMARRGGRRGRQGRGGGDLP